jgi:hypothetical protein
MKKPLYLISGSLLTLLFLGFIAVHVWIDVDVKNNITVAKEKYPGTAEDALIAYLLDINNSTQDRTSIAIWTLGQIKSEKALPILEEFYQNDPKGETCKGKHDTVLCQYEIYKALKAINSNRVLLHSRLNK